MGIVEAHGPITLPPYARPTLTTDANPVCRRNHEFWFQIFESYGHTKNPYTVEAITIRERIIFTSDEENVKAILATQFQDYGKGPQFRKEWKEFLGLSESCLSPMSSWVVTALMCECRHLYHRWRDVA
jgi:hypothetical protein